MNTRDIAPWVPFGLYDFFGYLFPGIFLSASILTFLKFSLKGSTLFEDICKMVNVSGTLKSILFGTFLIVLLYILGHLVSNLSSIIYGIINDGITNYPVFDLLKIKKDIREYTRATHGYFFLVLNLYILLPLFLYNKIHTLKIWVILSIVCLLLLFRVIIIIFENIPGGKTRIKKIADLKPIRVLFLYPYKGITFYLILVKKLISVYNPFDDEFIAAYKRKFKDDFGIDAEGAGTNNFWFPYHKVINSTAENVTMLRNWLYLYSFSRNISITAYLVCFTMVVVHSFGVDLDIIAFKVQLGCTFLFAWVLGLGYWRIFHTYYTKFILRTYLFLDRKAIESEDK